MKKVAHILYLIGAIYSYVGAGALAITGSVFAILGAVNVFKPGDKVTVQDANVANAVFLGVGIGLVVLAVLFILAGVFGQKARNALQAGQRSKGPYVTALVFGILTDSPLLVVPAVFSIILSSRREREKEEVDGEVVD